MRIVFLQVLLLAAVNNLCAQNAGRSTLKGFVTDELGAMPGVSLHIKGTQTGTASGTDGTFIISNAPSGKAEAVQRISSVAVSRYHGEAGRATVRGTPFTWTSTLMNGTRLPSSDVGDLYTHTDGRQYKFGSADMPGGDSPDNLMPLMMSQTFALPIHERLSVRCSTTLRPARALMW